MTIVYDANNLLEDCIGQPLGIPSDLPEELVASLDAARILLGDRERCAHLGFIDTPDQDVSDIIRWAAPLRERTSDVVVVGIGGSSLGAKAVLESHEDRAALEPQVHFAENVDPVEFDGLLRQLDMERTLVVVITKSGSTIETMTKFWILYDRLVAALGAARASARVVAITDPTQGSLRPLARERGFHTFPVPPAVGGRFSVLTPVGLVPLALGGYDIETLMAGARQAREVALGTPARSNAALLAAGHLHSLYRAGVDQIVMMPYARQLYELTHWFRQLWAESLGKAKNRRGEVVHEGMTPIAALGAIDQHSQVQLYMEGPRDKVVVFLETQAFARDMRVPERGGFPDKLAHLRGKSLGEILQAELQGTRAALAQSGRPSCTWRFDTISPSAVGGFLFAWQFITAVMGELMEIDAFDQPGVELGKKIAHGLLGKEELADYAELGAPKRASAEPVAFM